MNMRHKTVNYISSAGPVNTINLTNSEPIIDFENHVHTIPFKLSTLSICKYKEMRNKIRNITTDTINAISFDDDEENTFIILKVHVQDVLGECLIDTGASLNYMSTKYFNQLNRNDLKKEPSRFKTRAANGIEIKNSGQVVIPTRFSDNETKMVDYIILNEIIFYIIIGINFC